MFKAHWAADPLHYILLFPWGIYGWNLYINDFPLQYYYHLSKSDGIQISNLTWRATVCASQVTRETCQAKQCPYLQLNMQEWRIIWSSSQKQLFVLLLLGMIYIYIYIQILSKLPSQISKWKRKINFTPKWQKKQQLDSIIVSLFHFKVWDKHVTSPTAAKKEQTGL